MHTGEPISGCRLKFHNLNGEVKYSGETDENGLFETDIDIKVFATNDNKWNPELTVG